MFPLLFELIYVYICVSCAWENTITSTHFSPLLFELVNQVLELLDYAGGEALYDDLMLASQVIHLIDHLEEALGTRESEHTEQTQTLVTYLVYTHPHRHSQHRHW